MHSSSSGRAKSAPVTLSDNHYTFLLIFDWHIRGGVTLGDFMPYLMFFKYLKAHQIPVDFVLCHSELESTFSKISDTLLQDAFKEYSHTNSKCAQTIQKRLLNIVPRTTSGFYGVYGVFSYENTQWEAKLDGVGSLGTFEIAREAAAEYDKAARSNRSNVPLNSDSKPDKESEYSSLERYIYTKYKCCIAATRQDMFVHASLQVDRGLIESCGLHFQVTYPTLYSDFKEVVDSNSIRVNSQREVFIRRYLNVGPFIKFDSDSKSKFDTFLKKQKKSNKKIIVLATSLSNIDSGELTSLKTFLTDHPNEWAAIMKGHDTQGSNVMDETNSTLDNLLCTGDTYADFKEWANICDVFASQMGHGTAMHGVMYGKPQLRLSDKGANLQSLDKRRIEKSLFEKGCASDPTLSFEERLNALPEKINTMLISAKELKNKMIGSEKNGHSQWSKAFERIIDIINHQYFEKTVMEQFDMLREFDEDDMDNLIKKRRLNVAVHSVEPLRPPRAPSLNKRRSSSRSRKKSSSPQIRTNRSESTNRRKSRRKSRRNSTVRAGARARAGETVTGLVHPTV